MRRLLIAVAMAVSIVVVISGLCVFSGPYLDRRAIRQANEFCSLVSVGEPVEAVRAKAEKNSVSLERRDPRPGGEERYVAWFSGFLLNAAYCDIAVTERKVSAKFVEEELW